MSQRDNRNDYHSAKHGKKTESLLTLVASFFGRLFSTGTCGTPTVLLYCSTGDFACLVGLGFGLGWVGLGWVVVSGYNWKV